MKSTFLGTLVCDYVTYLLLDSFVKSVMLLEPDRFVKSVLIVELDTFVSSTYRLVNIVLSRHHSAQACGCNITDRNEYIRHLYVLCRYDSLFYKFI